MKLPKPMELLDAVRIFEHEHRATILTGLGVAGLWTTAWMAYKAGPRARDILKEKRKDIQDTRVDDTETKRTIYWETVKEMAPILAPPILLGGVSTACIIGSHTVSNHRIAALSAAYTITDNALREYKGKVTDLLGEKKAQQIRENISRDHVQKNPPPPDEQIIFTGDGDVLCLDEYSGRYFRSNAEKIGRVILKLSNEIQSEMWISLNDFYAEIGLPPVKMGEELGWSVERTNKGIIPIHYTATMTKNKIPCLAVQFDTELRY